MADRTQKEPWQMTKEEYIMRQSQPNPVYPMGYPEGGIGTPKQIKEDVYSPLHREAVEYAIKQGKPVPAEVLKDYPDLARGNDKLCPVCGADREVYLLMMGEECRHGHGK